MSRRHLATMIGGTVACALGIGFFMQRADTAAPRSLMTPLPAAVQQTVLAPVGWAGLGDSTHLEIRKISLTSAIFDTEPPALSVPRLENGEFQVVSSPLVSGPVVPADPVTPMQGCAVSATATPADMASVDLRLVAPCAANQRVTVHHSGMMFTDVTDEDGNLKVRVPVLSERAVFIFAFADGSGTVALTRVPDLQDFDRVAVQWAGPAGFQVHAREFGAGYGEAGHVWSGREAPAAEGGGVVSRLGNAGTLEPQLVEVYTYPTGTGTREGTVTLTVEAEVTAENCGRTVSAQSLERRAAAGLRTRDMTLTMPDCSAIGDFLVLNDLIADLKIAAR